MVDSMSSITSNNKLYKTNNLFVQTPAMAGQGKSPERNYNVTTCLRGTVRVDLLTFKKRCN